MPLRDHFRPPLDDKRHWQGMHGVWPTMIVANLRKKLPKGFFAEPTVQTGRSAEIDVSTFEDVDEAIGSAAAQDVYEVRVYDERCRTQLVAAVEIVSPANKDRPEKRRLFAAKCAGLLRERVSVVIVDVVTTRASNLYGELLELVGHADPKLGAEAGSLYASACRMTKRDDKWLLESWFHSLELGAILPTLPLWLADNLAVPLELEKSYEEGCEILGIA